MNKLLYFIMFGGVVSLGTYILTERHFDKKIDKVEYDCAEQIYNVRCIAKRAEIENAIQTELIRELLNKRAK